MKFVEYFKISMSQNFETSFCYNDKAVVKIMFILPEIRVAMI